MIIQNLTQSLCKEIAALFCAASLFVSSPVTDPGIRHCENEAQNNIKAKKYLMDKKLWCYLRKGINYLEASGKEVPLSFEHPGGKAYGPLALTPIAIKDVQRKHPELKKYDFKDVVAKRSLYEKFAILYADMLLKHYIKIDYYNMPRQEVFQMLQKAWFLGPTLYIKGHQVIASRQARALEFLSKQT